MSKVTFHEESIHGPEISEAHAVKINHEFCASPFAAEPEAEAEEEAPATVEAPRRCTFATERAIPVLALHLPLEQSAPAAVSTLPLALHMLLLTPPVSFHSTELRGQRPTSQEPLDTRERVPYIPAP